MSEEALEKEITWGVRLEEYFASTGEKANCLAWCHKRAEERYSASSIWIDLPVIILGVLNGATSIGSKSLFGDSDYASIGIGAVALITSILNTIGSYFSWSRRAEAHKIASLQYAKLYRFLSIEMSLPRYERMSPRDLLKYVKEQYDRLNEISPLLPPGVISMFKEHFKEATNISKPDELNGLEAITIFEEASVPEKNKNIIIVEDVRQL